MSSNLNKLKLVRLGIDTQHEFVVYMRSDCHVCISEGFETLTRIAVHLNGKKIIAALHVVNSALLAHHEVSLSESAFIALGANEGDYISFSHMPQIDSLAYVRAKMYGKRLNKSELSKVINDITAGKYSNVHLAAFIAACAGDNMDIVEIAGLTEAMVDAGSKLNWRKKVVVDKHCVGGLPGNRTTPIVVSIVAEAGLTIPKTSSRAITSPAGTADVMETMAPVNLKMKAVRKIVNDIGGCIIWGASVNLSPADDILIRVERALDVDSEGQMIASVLSKKAAAGSTHVVIDIPVGDTAKVRSEEEALKLKYYFHAVGNAIGLKVKVLITDGQQPVGRGIGPALEAKDVLSVLRGEPEAPKDLSQRAIDIAGSILELAEISPAGKGKRDAEEILKSGRALKRFMAICEAQGGFQEPPQADYIHEVKAISKGTVKFIDNRKLAKVAKLAGAPHDAAAGIEFFSTLGKKIRKGQVLFAIHAVSKGELKYALEFLDDQEIVRVE